MNVDDYESLPTSSVGVHMTAGAFAGIMEHCVMYPLDSVKTRMQVLTPGSTTVGGVGSVFSEMVRKEGLLRPLRGIGSMIGSAGPAHALYFSCYEFIKNKLINSRTHQFNNLVYGFAGCVATLLHDGVMNPAEVVKQRLQMYNSPYRSVAACIRHVYLTEGVVAFYRSYTTQLTMNVPFQVIHFITYESAQNITNPEHIFNPKAHVVSGAFAGAVAAACTTPLDVCKTLLNTQQGVRPQGMVEAFRTVYRYGGVKGFFRGLSARVLYQMPATAICWSTYEFFKYLLQNSQGEVKLRSDLEDVSAVAPSAMAASPLQSTLPRTSSFQGAGLYFNNKPPAPVLLEVTCTRG